MAKKENSNSGNNNNNNSVQIFTKGVNNDTSLLTQDEKTLLYMLNGTDETKEGDRNTISNYPANKLCQDIATLLPVSHVIVGQVYIGDYKYILLIRDTENNIDSIQVFNGDTCQLEQIFVTNKFNFNPDYPIDVVYRLRRGCERTIYFTDNLNLPRYYNLDRPELFEDSNGNFDVRLTNLVGNFYTIPKFQSLTVIEEGSLDVGAIVIGLQYVDNDNNVSHITTLSKKVEIFKDNINNNYYDIYGSSSIDDFASAKDKSSKAIKISFVPETLDTSYAFYRLVFIHYKDGTNNISKVYQSDNISTYQTEYIYNSSESLVELDILELQQEPILIAKAKNILAKDNRLHLANTTENFIDYCKLQKYASKITSFCTISAYNIADINNPFCAKKPNHLTGYMPGDVYSFGIVYIFDNGVRTPVFHIPGRSNIAPTKPQISGVTLYDMAENNINTTQQYKNLKRNSCSEEDFWGVDYNNNPLLNTNVRHHRFPTRKDLNLSFINTTFDVENTTHIEYSFEMQVDLVGTNPRPPIDFKEISSVKFKDYFTDNTSITTWMNIDETLETESTFTAKASYHKSLLESEYNKIYSSSEVSFIHKDGAEHIVSSNLVLPNNEVVEPQTSNPYVSYKLIRNRLQIPIKQNLVNTATVFGILFDNIECPDIITNDGSKIIGYEIVRQERKDKDKNILDTGFLTPANTDEKNYYTIGTWNIDLGKDKKEGIETASYPKTYDTGNTFWRGGPTNAVAGLWNPEFQFNNKELVVEKIKILGVFSRERGYLGNKQKHYTINSVIESNNDAGTDVEYRPTFDAFNNQNSMSLICGIERKEFNEDIVQIIDENRTFDRGFTYIRGYINDITDGTSYNPEVHSQEEEDKDGLDLYFLGRESQVSYEQTTLSSNFNCKIQYLNALSYINTKIGNKEQILYNVTTDSKMGVIIPETLGNINLKEFYRGLPYIALWKDNTSFYSDFREAIYYKETNNYFNFTNQETTHTTPIYSGDIYIGEIRPQHSVYIGTVTKEREKKSNLWRWILSGVLTVGGIILGIFAPAAIVAAGALVATGLSIGAKALEIETMLRSYSEDWQKGVLDSIADNSVSHNYGLGAKLRIVDKELEPFRHSNYVVDDEMRYLIDGVNSLFFETTINTNLRYRTKEDLTTILNVDSSDKELYSYYLNKLTTFSQDKKENRAFRGVPFPEMYLHNKDYIPTNYGKFNYMLPLTYDCCSSCSEYFPHRIYYSEQSFAEELTDNYKQFKPNNYIDLAGEYGEINNLFSLLNNLFAHTEEALWMIPTNFQERVNTDLTTYIGTGEYFSIPPKLITEDSSGNIFGLQHKFATNIFPNGYVFISANQKKPVIFDGKQFIDLTKFGYSKWFYRHVDKDGNYIITYFPKEEKLFFTRNDNSKNWTISFNLQKNCWNSFHSFIPSRYLSMKDYMFTWKNGIAGLWKHDIEGKYGEYYGVKYPFIIEYVTTENMLVNKVYDYFRFYTEAFIYSNGTFVPIKDVTYNKALLTTDTHSTGVLTLIVQNLENSSYFETQAKDVYANEIYLNKKETDWYFNEIRNYREDYTNPIFLKTSEPMNEEVHNNNIINYNQDWQDIDMLSGKYLRVRLIFNNENNYKLVQHFINLNMSNSLR